MIFNRKYILFGSLYFSQFIPLGFFSESLPVYLRSIGYSLELIGSVHLLLLPWMLKFLWAPFVDKIGSGKGAGHYRYWILTMQLIVFLCLITTSFIDVSANLSLLFISIGLLSFFSSTQDIATDAFAVEVLKKDEQGFGNSIQNSSHFLGSMIGGGLMLLLLSSLGWVYSNIILAVIVLVPCLILILNWNRFIPVQTTANRKFSFDFFKRPGNIKWVFILLLLPLGNGMADFIFKPFLVDYGYSLDEIGLLRGIIGLSASFVGAISAGFFIKRNNRSNLLINTGIILAFSLLLFIIPIYFHLNIWSISSIIIINRFLSGFFITILFTLIMQKCESGKAGTDFSIQMAVLTFSSHGLGSVSAGYLTPVIGYNFFYLLSFAICISAVFLYKKYFSIEEKSFHVNSVANQVI
jgi:MFS family permease